MPKRCITGGCKEWVVPGRGRCSHHGPKNAAREGPNPYDYSHQLRRAARIEAGEGCAMAHLGGCHGPLHLDHKLPRSLGGWNGEDNEQILCERHNISKGGANRLRTGRAGRKSRNPR